MLPAPPLSPPRLLLLPTVAAAAAAPWNSNSCGAAKPSSLSFAPLTPPKICTLRGSSRRRCFCARSKLDTDGGWEDPADGYGSEYEELEQEEDEGEGSSDGEQSGLTAIVNSYTMDFCNEELIKEVEQLLSPEEKASLQQNEAPDLNKISTVKFFSINMFYSSSPYTAKKWSAFHSLALSAQIPFMDKLLELGVDIDSADKDGFTALHKAVMGKKEAVISHLLRKGANPHLNDWDGATPLHYAVQVGAMQTVKLLIKYKVDINVADNEGWTPLHVAIQSRSRDIAKVLLVNGADKTRRTKDGKTPLDLCLCYGRDFKSYELAKLLKLVPANRDP